MGFSRRKIGPPKNGASEGVIGYSKKVATSEEGHSSLEVHALRGVKQDLKRRA